MNNRHPDFWQQVDRRITENQAIIPTGFSPRYARILSWVGLHFWIIGSLVSFCLTTWLFTRHYFGLMQAVRIIIWR